MFYHIQPVLLMPQEIYADLIFGHSKAVVILKWSKKLAGES